jgi:dCMP deaminase
MRPSIQDTMMSVAYTMADRSTCSRRHNGAVVATDSGVVLSTGYNGSLSGMPHCEHDEDFVGCTTAVHAEANSIYFAARNGVRIKDSTIYCTTEPCQKCAEAIVQSGITSCVYDQEYRIHDGIELLQSAGIAIHQYQPYYSKRIYAIGGLL